MSAIGLLTAVVLFALTHSVAGMIPVAFTGDALFAVWLTSVLAGIAGYIGAEQAMSGVRP